MIDDTEHPTSAAGPTDRTDPTDPTDPTDRTDRTDRAKRMDRTGPTRNALSRRRLLGTAGAAGGAGLAFGAAGGVLGHAVAGTPAPEAALSTVGSTAVDFHGPHQAGIVTPPQAHGHLVAFDLAPGTGRAGAAALLRRWSRTAGELTRGNFTAGADGGTGAALDAGPSSLTVTIGFGRSFFERTGLVARRPEALAPLPDFSADALDPDRSGGDLWIQIGADDALVAFDALRTLQRDAAAESSGGARVRWQMTGFNRTPGATARPMPARNLMGQVDGTNNPDPADPDFAGHVFVPPGGDPAWMSGGSYAVVRRIRMLLDAWEGHSVADQEAVIGRRKTDGAPLSGGGLGTPADLGRRDGEGGLLIPARAHIRVAAPETNGGATMLRRSFSYHDGLRADGAPDAGLLFVCWQAHPDRGFVPVQRKLDRGDALSRFLRHEASALFAVPPGAGEGEYVGQRLLEG